MKKQVWNPGALLAPVPPALVSCGTLEQPNLLTVGWTGILNTRPPMTYVSIRPERFSHGLIAQSGVFVINLTPASLVRAADFCGVRSGRELNKWEACGLTPVPASKVDAPLVDECPVALECRVTERKLLGSHEMFFADIVALDVDERLIDPTGRLDLASAGLAAYAHGEYFALGEKLGSFGFSVRKAPKKKPKRRPGDKPPASQASSR